MKGAGRERPRRRCLQRARSDPPDGVGDQGDDDRQHALERRLQWRPVAVGGGEPGQGEQHDGAGQHEESAGGERALQAVQLQTQVGGKLLGLGARQQHAEVQRRQERALINPSAADDQFLVQDGDLAGWTAERDQANLEP